MIKKVISKKWSANAGGWFLQLECGHPAFVANGPVAEYDCEGCCSKCGHPHGCKLEHQDEHGAHGWKCTNCGEFTPSGWIDSTQQ